MRYSRLRRPLHKVLTYLMDTIEGNHSPALSTHRLSIFSQALHHSDPNNGFPLLLWGGMLLRPELSRYQEGCTTLESAAIIYARAMDGPTAAKAIDTCLKALGDLQQQQQGSGDPPSSSGGTRPRVTPSQQSDKELTAAAVTMSPSGKKYNNTGTGK